MRVNMTATGLYPLESGLIAAQRRTDQLEPVFKIIGDEMIDSTRRVFETSGQSANRPWQPLKPETIDLKRRHGRPFPDKPLMGELRLFESLTVKGHPEMILDVTDYWVRYGTDVPYAEYHDDGTDDLARRRPIMFTPIEGRRWIGYIQRYIFDGSLPNA